MSMGSKIYGSYMHRGQDADRSRMRKARKHGRRAVVICPFTLEAVRDCVVRNRTPRVACRFSLEACLAPR